MTKLTTLFLSALCMATIMSRPALAATKCVNLSPSMTYLNGSTSHNGPQWFATFSGNFTIAGIGVCSTTRGYAIGEKTDVLKAGYASSSCWCKMLMPAVSSWFFINDFQVPAQCRERCTNECMGAITGSSASNIAFRSAMFSNLTD